MRRATWAGAFALLMLASASARAVRRRLTRWRGSPAASAAAATGTRMLATTSAVSPAPRALLGPLELLFLGTCSSSPSSTRNQLAVALRAGGDTWLFDCGEATQKQMMAARWRTSAISRIFISHMHGDHVFGLPGMLCNVGMAAGANGRHVTIVGPAGLRQWVRVALGVTYSSLGETTYCVHELVGLKAEEAASAADGGFSRTAAGPPHPCERGGLDLAPDERGIWTIPQIASDPALSVFAAEVTHRVPTVGFAALEHERPGSVDAAALLPILAAEGVLPSAIGGLKRGEPLTLPSGRVLKPADFMKAATRRKLVVLGDLSEASAAMRELASGCDLLVHEATNAFLQSDREKQATLTAAASASGLAERARTTAKSVQTSAMAKGHSTPQMAGRLARDVGARHLALTHFSAQYSGAGDEASLAVMAEIEALAQQECDPNVTAVTAARDFMGVTIAINGDVVVTPPPADPAPSLVAGAVDAATKQIADAGDSVAQPQS